MRTDPSKIEIVKIIYFFCRDSLKRSRTFVLHFRSGHEVDRKLSVERSSEDDYDDASRKITVKQVIAEPGSLVFFFGAKTFHRAAPITGPGIRVGLVFTYGETEGCSNSDNSNEWDPGDVAAAAASCCCFGGSTRSPRIYMTSCVRTQRIHDLVKGMEQRRKKGEEERVRMSCLDDLSQKQQFYFMHNAFTLFCLHANFSSTAQPKPD